jgi:hypothetical protein
MLPQKVVGYLHHPMDTNNDDNDMMEEDVVDINSETPVPKKPKKPRKIKPLPEDLAGLTDSTTNCEKFSITKEANANNKSEQFGKELGAVQSGLKILNVDQLQQLCNGKAPSFGAVSSLLTT